MNAARRRQARCRDCGDPIIWVVTAARGTRLPLDASPDDRGVFRILGPTRDGLVAEPLGAHELNQAVADGALLFLPHRRHCRGRKPYNPCPPEARELLRRPRPLDTDEQGDHR